VPKLILATLFVLLLLPIAPALGQLQEEYTPPIGESVEVRLVPWSCEDEELLMCTRKPGRGPDYVVQLETQISDQLVTVTPPLYIVEGTSVRVEAGATVTGYVWRVWVIGTAGTRWAAGQYQAYAVIPPASSE